MVYFVGATENTVFPVLPSFLWGRCLFWRRYAFHPRPTPSGLSVLQKAGHSIESLSMDGSEDKLFARKASLIFARQNNVHENSPAQRTVPASDTSAGNKPGCPPHNTGHTPEPARSRTCLAAQRMDTDEPHRHALGHQSEYPRALQRGPLKCPQITSLPPGRASKSGSCMTFAHLRLPFIQTHFVVPSCHTPTANRADKQ
jgi:hypothetical protein